jgi:hypothetical protein
MKPSPVEIRREGGSTSSSPTCPAIVAADRASPVAGIAPGCHAREHADVPPPRRETLPWPATTLGVTLAIRFHETSFGRL